MVGKTFLLSLLQGPSFLCFVSAASPYCSSPFYVLSFSLPPHHALPSCRADRILFFAFLNSAKEPLSPQLFS